ncbi:MAG: hypothetical protein RSA17_06910, partial [Ruthenibacterium sp.]
CYSFIFSYKILYKGLTAPSFGTGISALAVPAPPQYFSAADRAEWNKIRGYSVPAFFAAYGFMQGR